MSHATTVERHIIDVPGDAQLEIFVQGRGPTVLMLASLGRAAEDFDDLAERVAEAGYRVIRPQPRGIGHSSPASTGLSLDDLAADVGAIIDWSGSATVTLIGHAFGNRLARNTAHLYPEKVERLVLLACGGQVPIDPPILASLTAVFDESLTPEAHLDHVWRAFFAPGHDASVWAGGWFPPTATMQSTAVRTSNHAAWKLGGGQPMLIVQAMQDVIAPPANAESLLAAAPHQMTRIDIDEAGHAMLPEQPEAIGEAVLGFLKASR